VCRMTRFFMSSMSNIFAIWPTHIMLFNFATLLLDVSEYETPSYEVFSILLLLPPFRSKYCPQNHVLRIVN
jgi:hypothetical protein